MRTFGTMTATGATLNWLSEALNKRCITLDLRKPAGLAIAKRLVADSDIVVENFTTGTLEGWGLGYEDMKAVNPDVILVRITASAGESFLDRMIALVEGAERQKTPNEIALNILLAGLTIVFLIAVATLQPFAIYSSSPQSLRIVPPQHP